MSYKLQTKVNAGCHDNRSPGLIIPPAVGESGLGVSGSCVVSVEAFLFASCPKTHNTNNTAKTHCFKQFFHQLCIFTFNLIFVVLLLNSPLASHSCSVWPPACGGAGTPGTSPCSARPPCGDAASAPPPPSAARPRPPTPPRGWTQSPHPSPHPGMERYNGTISDNDAESPEEHWEGQH